MPERAAALLLARLHDRQAVGPMGPQAQLPRSKGPALHGCLIVDDTAWH